MNPTLFVPEKFNSLICKCFGIPILGLCCISYLLITFLLLQWEQLLLKQFPLSIQFWLFDSSLFANYLEIDFIFWVYWTSFNWGIIPPSLVLHRRFAHIVGLLRTLHLLSCNFVNQSSIIDTILRVEIQLWVFLISYAFQNQIIMMCLSVFFTTLFN
jgi:hypothetical protein